MRISDFYRGLLRLYPADFHNEFSEGCTVFSSKKRPSTLRAEVLHRSPLS